MHSHTRHFQLQTPFTLAEIGTNASSTDQVGNPLETG